MPECRDADILVSSLNGEGAAGHEALRLTFVNQSGHSCYLQGFPTVSLVDAHGSMLLQAQTTLNGFIGGAVANGGHGLTAPPYVVLTLRLYFLTIRLWNQTAMAPTRDARTLRACPYRRPDGSGILVAVLVDHSENVDRGDLANGGTGGDGAGNRRYAMLG